MFNRRIKLSVMGGVVALGLALSGQAMAAFTAQEAAKVEAECESHAGEVPGRDQGRRCGARQRQGCPGLPEHHQGGLPRRL